MNTALDRLRWAKLYGRLHKCEFLKDKVDYLGFEVSKEGIHASSEKVKAVLDWPQPQSVHDVCSFLGLASYYRKFIKGFPQWAKPLTYLTQDKAVWHWGDAEANNFMALKVLMITAPILHLPDFEQQFVVTIDASDVAIAAILEQNFSSGLQPIAFASRKLNATEIHYSAYKRGMLGIAWALGQWKHYFQSPHPIIIRTDHAPLRHLPNQTSVNSKGWNWISILQVYNVEIRHIPSKKNPADSLSGQLVSNALVWKGSGKYVNKKCVMQLRVSANASDEEIQSALDQLFSQSFQGPQGHNQCPQGSIVSTNEYQAPIQDSSEVKPVVIAPTAVSKLQLDNSFRDSLYSLLRHEDPYDEIIMELENGKTQVVKNDEVYKRMNGILAVHSHGQDAELGFWRIIVLSDANIKENIMQELDSTPYSAHPGIQSTLGKVRWSFFWKGMTEDIPSFVENC